MSEEFPEIATEYLTLCQEKKRITKRIKELKEPMTQWLYTFPKKRFSFPSTQEFGPGGVLRFYKHPIRENVRRDNLSTSLAEFFTSVFTDQSKENIEQMCDAAANYVWQNRKIKNINIDIKRTESKKKKRKLE